MHKKTFSEKQYRNALIKFFGILFALILFLILDIRHIILVNNFTNETLKSLIAILFGYFLYKPFHILVRSFDKVEDEILNQAHNAKLGMDGENSVDKWLTNFLPTDEYIVLKNVELPGHVFDIDFVVIGRSGVFLLEVKNFTHRVKFSEEKYFRVYGGVEKWLYQLKMTRVKKLYVMQNILINISNQWGWERLEF